MNKKEIIGGTIEYKMPKEMANMYLKTAKEEISKLDLDKLSNRLFSKANVILECEDIADFIVKKYEL